MIIIFMTHFAHLFSSVVKYSQDPSCCCKDFTGAMACLLVEVDRKNEFDFPFKISAHGSIF